MSSDLGTEWAEWTRDWIQSLNGRGISANTITVYQRTLDQFTRWLSEQGREPDLSALTSRDVDAFMAHLVNFGRSESTRRVRLMALRAFFGWVLDEPHSPLTINPAGRIKAPVAALPTIEIVPEDDLRAVLATCDPKTFIGARDEAILRLLYSTGLRRSELVGLSMDDVDVTRGEMYVMGKGSKPRIVSFGGSRTPLALSRYVRARRRHVGAGDAAFFLASRSSTAHGFRMTGGGIGLMLKRRCQLADVTPFRPHQLRHTWAHNSKVAGLSDEDLERMAGWSSPMMVRRYGRAMADQRAKDAHRSLGLGDKL